jgi:BirA family biotin operon repressor/biotin-[acetyl-CoA-carboxylase] ligase
VTNCLATIAQVNRTAVLTSLLEGSRWERVSWIPSIGSTNSELMTRARYGAGLPEILIADEQTAGRGRRGRSWEAPSGSSLMMSLLVHPTSDSAWRGGSSAAQLTTTALALGMCEAVRELLGVHVRVKWPNDLVVDPDPAHEGSDDGPGYRKVAGILAESVVKDGRIVAVVVGVGCNTGWSEIPEEMALKAASLNLLGDCEVDRVQLAARTVHGFDRRLELLMAGQTDLVVQEAQEMSATLGRRVRVLEPSGDAWEGVAESLDGDGRLLVRSSSGIRSLDAADIEHLRLAP